MAKTREFIYAHLPLHDLISLVDFYLCPPEASTTDYGVGLFGHAERCLTTTDVNATFRGACRGGHLALAEMMIARGANDWDWGCWPARAKALTSLSSS